MCAHSSNSGGTGRAVGRQGSTLVVMSRGSVVATSRGSDPAQIRALLAAAQGYAVLDRGGTRIGAFVELAGGDRIAIRHDGVFVWRRRLLPMTAVANVVPDRRAVVLTVDRQALADTETPPTPAPGTSASAEEYPPGGDWQDRIKRYVVPAAEDTRRPVARDADQPTPEPCGRDQRTAERHLLFISTSGGYALVEREGPPPPVGRGIEIPEQAVSFLVRKVGPSPLPNDPRTCAYLEPSK